MQNKLTLHFSLPIAAARTAVWEALTNPELVKKYFFGTDVRTDWQKGSPITFSGEWEGQTYEDKGHILDIDPGQFVTYNYWSSMSGTEDKPENYATITYRLTQEGGKTVLHVTQDGVKDQEALEHSEQNWRQVMGAMKDMVEA